MINEVTIDISHHVLYSTLPIGTSWIGQVNIAGKGLLPTPPSAMGLYGCIPTCYIYNKKGHIKINCWFNPFNKGWQGQSSYGCGSGMNQQVPRPVYFLGQPQLGHQPHVDQMGEPHISSQPEIHAFAPSSTDIQNLFMIALTQMSIKQNKTR